MRNVDLFDRILKKYGSVAIFVFALTPLPDDWLYIPLGILRYNVAKILVPSFVGKLLLNLAIVYGGLFFVDFIGDSVGLSNNWIISVVSVFLGIGVFFVALKVDWEKYLKKYLHFDLEKRVAAPKDE